MATFKATFCVVNKSSRTAVSGETMPVPELSSATRLTDLTTSGSSQNVQESGADFEAPSAGFVRLFSDGAVNIAAGASPTASATAGMAVPANTVYDIALREGEKLAVINA